jgi:hypothetical protein
VRLRINHELCQHAVEIMTKAVTAWMGRVRVAPWRKQPRWALLPSATHWLSRGLTTGCERIEYALGRCGESGRVAARQEPLDARLMRSSIAFKTQRASNVAGLAGGPFGHREQAATASHKMQPGSSRRAATEDPPAKRAYPSSRGR